MARWTMTFETNDADAEERVRTMAALAASAYRMKVVEAGEVGKPPIIPAPKPIAIDTGTRTVTPPPPEGTFRPVPTPAPPPDVEVEDEPNTGEVESR
jgi:hypothetical protein